MSESIYFESNVVPDFAKIRIGMRVKTIPYDFMNHWAKDIGLKGNTFYTVDYKKKYKDCDYQIGLKEITDMKWHPLGSMYCTTMAQNFDWSELLNEVKVKIVL
jgi:hypothetical protein